ncbi:hypothetical protein [Flavobacterium sp. FlaQc-48]|uniref:hypothetical protein n=1 Tax=Flavobacterium sp. FlaQc-48 TaxID=3374181 RepID=UPI0037567805
MQHALKNSFSKTIIILMLFFLCLPCSAKREIKLTLDIPLNEVENKLTGPQSGICFIAAATKKVCGSFQYKAVKKYCANDFSVFRQFTLSFPLQNTSFPEKKGSKIIPIYLLHEQYLI